MSNTLFEEIKWFVVVNPAAGNGKCRKILPAIKNSFKYHHYNVTIQISTGKLSITELVGNAINNGFRYILAIGGDGTNNEAINGICKQKVCPISEITYSLIPVGTGNDWFRLFNFRKGFDDWIEIIKKRKVQLFDIGKVDFINQDQKKDFRYFINVAGLAYDAYTVKLLEEITTPSKLKYLTQVLKGLFTYRPEKAIISFNDKNIHTEVYTINIGLGKYSGGGMRLVPHGGRNDGRFAVTIAKSMKPLRVILALAKFYNGRIGNHPKVSCDFTRSISIDHEISPIGCEVDGEWIGYTPATFSIYPNQLKVLVP